MLNVRHSLPYTLTSVIAKLISRFEFFAFFGKMVCHRHSKELFPSKGTERFCIAFLLQPSLFADVDKGYLPT